MPGPPFFAGDRVSLHPVEDEDVDFLQRNHNDPVVRQSMPRVHPQNQDDTREEYVEHGDDAVGLLVCAGAEPDAERLCFCALFRLNEDPGRAEVGIWLAPDAQGQGYATEALELLVEYAFDERRLHRLDAAAMATNDRSRAMLDRVGFSEEGHRSEHYYVNGEYVDRVVSGLLESEWREASDEA